MTSGDRIIGGSNVATHGDFPLPAIGATGSTPKFLQALPRDVGDDEDFCQRISGDQKSSGISHSLSRKVHQDFAQLQTLRLFQSL